MTKAFIAAVFFAGLAATPALAAEYYIVQNPQTHQCEVVAQKPEPGLEIVGSPFGTRVEAENHLKTVTVCHGGTTGSNTTIIKKEHVDHD